MSKKILIPIGIILFLLFVNSGCFLSDAGNAPEVERIDSVIDDRSNLPANGATAFIRYYVYLENEEEHTDVSKIVITNCLGLEWVFEGNNLTGKWISGEGCFSLGCYSPGYNPHNIPLGNYTATIYKTDAEETEFQFDVYGRGNPDLNSGSIYTSEDGRTPQILRAPTDCSASINGNDLDISFTTNDEIISDVFIWYYDAAESYLGWSGWLSTISPVITNGINEYTLNVSSFPGIDNIIIVLYSYTSSETNGLYYRSWSAQLFL